MEKRIRILGTTLILLLCANSILNAKSVNYLQEIANRYFFDKNPLLKNVTNITTTHDKKLYALTDNGIVILNKTTNKWQKGEPTNLQLNTLLKPDIVDVINLGTYSLVASDKGLDKYLKNEKVKKLLNFPINQLAYGNNEIYAATPNGLFKENAKGEFKKVIIKDNVGRVWGYDDVRGVAISKEGTLWIATPAGVISKIDNKYKFYTGKDGVPYMNFTRVTIATNGIVWFGTHMGAVFFNGKSWGYRQGKLWLPNDNIISIAAGKNGAVWFGTKEGIGKIYYKKMTLAKKAEIFENDIKKIKRTKFGFINEGHLKKAGDLSTLYLEDGDNDGERVSRYGAGEYFAYAATGKEIYKKRADKAFRALKLLQDLPQTSKKEQRPPIGYIARTIRSTDDPNPNIGGLKRDIEEQKNSDHLWKVYEPRWPKSGDGKWYWKSDTSSDELDGHFFFYGLYYNLVCKTEKEKAAVRDVVRKLIDHLITHNFQLVDFDGKTTRWGYYNPEKLNQDLTWSSNRGLKSLSMLSYLAVAANVTGNDKYSKISRELIEKHGYKLNAVYFKQQFGFGSGNQFDDEMSFKNYYNIMHYSKDKDLKDAILYAAYQSWRIEEPEMNPFYNFIYASFAIGGTFTDPWGTIKLDPWKGWLKDSIYTLENMPLDHITWGNKNSQRSDIIILPRQQVGDITDEGNLKSRGYRVNGKVLPVENRNFQDLGKDPWELDYAENNKFVSSGIPFLLSYYMGLYYKFL
jgi:hypothetical protein